MLSKDFKEFVALLKEHDAEYMIVGGYAVGVHGYPRYTGDLDIWLNPTKANAERVLKAIDAFGFGSFKLKVADLTKEDNVIQFGQPPLRIDLLTSIDGGIYIAENPVLGSMQGLAPSSVGGGFELTNNLQLMDLSAASGLTTLGGPLSLIGNTSILSLQELAGITAINGVLRLTGSSGLMYLAGLDNIDPGTILNLIIANNPGLFQCAAENLCTYLADPSSMASITGNATGCASRAELEAACTVLSVDEQATADGMLAVYPNPTPGELSLLPQVQGPGQLRVYDGAGVLLRTLHIADAAHTPVRIDLSDLAPGAYVVQLHTQDGVATRMVVRD